jgi:hypothetical protein
MKRNILTLITILSVIIAATSVSLAVKATKQRKLAEAEAEALRKKNTEMPTRASRRRAPPTERTEVARQSQAKTNELVTLQDSPAEPDAEAEQRRERPERESFEDRMAKMKEEDPEGYAEMIQRREERQQTMRYNLAKRTTTFMDLDTASMTEEERSNHELLLEKMANVWALTVHFQDPEQQPDREVMGELYNEMREARPLMDLERTVIFKQLGTDLGYEGEDAEAFASHVEDIIDDTSLQMPRSGGGRGGGGRGGGR